jgi:hypothetical protein
MSAGLRSWFSPVNSRPDALKVIQDSSGVFFVLAAIQGGLGLFIGVTLLLDAAVYGAGAFFVRRHYSRVAAAVLLLVALVAAGTTIGNRLGMEIGGGSNVFLALIALVAGAKAVEATWKLNGRFAQDLPDSGTANPRIVQGSPIRRLFMIGCYLSVLTIGAMILASILISEPCLSADVCSEVDDLVSGALFLGWIAGATGTAALGWRGRLLGARASAPGASQRFVVHSVSAE